MIRRIGVRLILVVGVTAILIIGVIAFFNIRALNTSLLTEVERHANQLSETVRHGTRSSVVSSCTPPESVATAAAPRTRPMNSR